MSSVEDLLAEKAMDYARFLISCAEPIKALEVLDSVAPVASLHHPDVLAMKASLKKQVDQYFSDEAYIKRYTVYDNGGVSNEPFSDTNLLNLFRASATIALTSQIKPDRYLSIGGGEGTVPLHVLHKNPNTSVVLSELLGVGGSVAAALEQKHPGRVSVTGRYDVPEDHVAYGVDKDFDAVECLEVIEHVTDDLLFLKNIRKAMSPKGVLLLSTPNSVDWIESKLVRDFGDKNWYHHVRAYTARSLATVLRKAGFSPTIMLEQRCLFVIAVPHEACDNPYTETAVYENGSDLGQHIDKVVPANLMTNIAERSVQVLAYQGVLLTS